MAKYCDEILGDLLLKEPLPGFPVSTANQRNVGMSRKFRRELYVHAR